MFLRHAGRLALVFGFFVGCGDDGGAAVDAGVDAAADLAVESPGPHPVGTAFFVLADQARGRDLPTQLWYPAAAAAAAEAAAGFPISEFEVGARRTAYANLLASADPACPSRTAFAARDAAPAAGSFPLIAVSHCHECTRFSTATVAARLASHGFVVVAVDHVGNTLWEQLAGAGLPLDTTTLALRVADIGFAIDQVTTAAAPVPRAVADTVDTTRIAVMGHSFGAVTAGKVAQDNPSIDAALALAAPMENPLLAGVTVAAIGRPLGFVLAREDNSITELGNGFIRDNYLKATGGAVKIELADAGHWSVSDLVGVVDGFDPGCGADTRQTDGQPFTYLPAETGRAITAAYATAFFKAYLQDDAGARSYLGTPRPTGVVTVDLK